MFLLYESERLSWSSRFYAAKHVSSCVVVVVLRAVVGSNGSALVHQYLSNLYLEKPQIPHDHIEIMPLDFFLD